MIAPHAGARPGPGRPRRRTLSKGPIFMTQALLSRSLGGALAALALLLPAAVRAEEPIPARPALPARASQPYAVLIGIGDYADKQIKPRRHAEADVKALYDLF